MEDNSKKTNGVGHNSEAPLFSEAVADQAVRFVSKLSGLVRSANGHMHYAINGKNTVERGVSLRDTHAYLRKLEKQTEDWHTVIETMKQGKDIHSNHNGGCKGSKLEIVGGSEPEFAQYLVDKTLPSDSDGKKYIKKVTGHGN